MEPERRPQRTGPVRWWKDLRTNMMYWRFRHVTRNRLRLRAWMAARRRRPPQAAYGGRQAVPFRPRGVATAVYYGRTQRRTWIAVGAMVVLLTALKTAAQQTYINPSLAYGAGALIVVAAIYWALRPF